MEEFRAETAEAPRANDEPSKDNNLIAKRM